MEFSESNHNKKSKLKIIICILVALIVLAVALFATRYVYITSNTNYDITIGIGERYAFSDISKDYTLSSYDNDIASIENSQIVGCSIGETTVCIQYSFFDREYCTVKVVKEPQHLAFDVTQLHLGVGETYTLKATYLADSKDFDMVYESSQPDIATISSDGIVTANSMGECTITATTYNNATATCTLKVSAAPSSISLPYSYVTLGVNEIITLTPTFNTDEYSNNLTLTSSDEKIAIVDGHTIKAVGTGDCVVMVTSHNDISATCNISVRKMPDAIDLAVLDHYSVNNDFYATIIMPDDCQANNVTVSVSNPDVLEIDSSDNMLIHCKNVGTSDLTLTLENGVTATKTITVGNYTSNYISDFRILNQYPELPTGCEVVSLTSVLNHYGMDVDMVTMADNYMPKSDSPYYYIDPDEYFIGSPHTHDGFGCYPNCIVKTAQNYFDANNIDDYVAVNITGCTAEELFDYIENDVPVITWVTSGFIPPTIDGTWYVCNKLITWYESEHCLVTTGYDKDAGTVTVADDGGGYSYAVSLSTFKTVFEGTDSKAVAILKK